MPNGGVNDSLEKSLAAHGFHSDDITDVFLTHLHFDHCGGSVNWNKDKTNYENLNKIHTLSNGSQITNDNILLYNGQWVLFN
jgi:metal-dependent hydrolase (beta-lactamase superfamily II)